MTIINIWAVLAASVVAMVVGFLWYGPLFGKTWGALMNFTPEKIEEAKKKGMTKVYIENFLSTILMAGVLAYFLGGTFTIGSALFVASLIWLGFVATVMLDAIFWESKPIKLYLINVSHRLVSFWAMAVILALWR